MSGELDPLYVIARKVLLDALDAVEPHLDAFVLVGAQAVYARTGEADLAVAPFTTDSDLAIDPSRLGSEPLLESMLEGAGFVQADLVGVWNRSIENHDGLRVAVDLLVPESLGGGGRRGARIPPHGRSVARKVSGLEGALVDKDAMDLAALDVADSRRYRIDIAGPAALIVAKIHKIHDRLSSSGRLIDKDALDVYRLLRGSRTEELVRRFRMLRGTELSGAATSFAVDQLPSLFGHSRAPGTLMAVRAAGPLADEDTLAASLAILTVDLLKEL